MSLSRIYFPEELKTGLTVTLDSAASRHLLTVLRLKVGDSIEVFNGQGGSYSATLKNVIKKSAVIQIEQFSPIERESPVLIHLGQAISRGEKMDFTIQKSVELGVNQITPLISERCGVHLKGERIEHRVGHWQKIAISASEQSGRCRAPAVNYPQSFADFLMGATGLKLISSLSEQPIALSQLPEEASSVTLLIGPEGGFSTKEVDQAINSGFYPWSLGPRVLRTETAAMVAIALIQSKWGDLSNPAS